MLLVLIVHLKVHNSPELCQNTPSLGYATNVLKIMTACCVNIFVLISGWFGIKPNAKSFCNFAFQCLFILISVYLACCVIGITHFTLGGFMACFLFIPDWDYWFIKCYILLYALSPMLNAFIENADRKIYRNLLIAFFAYIFIYDWVYIAAQDIEGGFSTIFMIALYLLARYCNKYRPWICNQSKNKTFAILIGTIMIVALVDYIAMYFGQEKIVGKIAHTYVSPFVVLISLLFVIAFSKLQFTSRFVNWIAASSFTVYLFHTHIELFETHYQRIATTVIDNCTIPVATSYLSALVIVTFIFSILIDQPRLFIWKHLSKLFFK